MDETESPETETTISFATGGTTGQTIGPYHLLQKIGEGGMGEVWVAEQQKPIRRKVALKLIKAGMDTKQVIARFESGEAGPCDDGSPGNCHRFSTPAKPNRVGHSL